jgi:hypothetical protein
MSRPRAHRVKTYKQRAALPFGGLAILADHVYAADERRALSDDDRTDLNIAYWLSMSAMLTGESSEQHWCTVVCSLNISLILAERGLGADYVPYIGKALDGAFRAKLRAKKTGIWRFDGEAITDIRTALEVHDEQVKVATKFQMRQSLLEVRRRIDEERVYGVAI